jgi:hypothetical protein
MLGVFSRQSFFDLSRNFRRGGRSEGPNTNRGGLKGGREERVKVIEPKFTVVAELKGDIPGLLTQADGVIAGFEGNPNFFPNSGPVLQALKAARKTLGDSYTASAPLKKSAHARSPAERALRARLTEAAHFTETCANNDPANGPAIIAASTFKQKAKSARTKPPLALKLGKVPGTVLADAKAAKKGAAAFYSWRYSLDNGQTWVEAAQTNTHLTLLEGIPLGKTVLVQVAVTQKSVRGPWSDSASLLVH